MTTAEAMRTVSWMDSPLNDETATNVATFVEGTATFQPSRMGLGQGIQLDGQNDYVDVSSLAGDVSGDFSITMWVKAVAGNTDRTLLAIKKLRRALRAEFEELL